MATTTYEASVGVLCIQGAFIEHINHLKKIAEKKNDFFLTVVEVRKPEQLAELDGLIIPGGESTTLSVFMQKDGFLEALKQWSSRTNPPTVTWGTCAGLIMISDDLSGKKQGGQTTIGGLSVEVTRNQFGRQYNSFEAPVKIHEPLLMTSAADDEQLSDVCQGVFIRAPGIGRVLSPDVKVLATLCDQDKTVVAVQQGNLIGSVFHPELTSDLRWHSYLVHCIITAKYPDYNKHK